MWQYQITKYDPNKRDEQGRYLDQNEWTEFSEVGENVSLEEYEKVESLYIEAAYELISADGIEALQLVYLEDYQNLCPYKEKAMIKKENIREVVRSFLRHEYWGKLESEKGFIHVGWDFYMYVGFTGLNTEAVFKVSDSGLFVESRTSPYNEKDS